MAKDVYIRRPLDPDNPSGPGLTDEIEMLAGVAKIRGLAVFAYTLNHPEVDPKSLYQLQFDGWIGRNRDYRGEMREDERANLLEKFYREVWGIETIDTRTKPDRDEQFSLHNIDALYKYIEDSGGRGELETKYQMWKKGEPGRESRFFITGIRI